MVTTKSKILAGRLGDFDRTLIEDTINFVVGTGGTWEVKQYYDSASGWVSEYTLNWNIDA